MFITVRICEKIVIKIKLVFYNFVSSLKKKRITFKYDKNFQLMKNTFTNLFFPPHQIQTLQSSTRRSPAPLLTHRPLKLKLQAVIFFALFMFVISSARCQAG